MTPLTAEQVEKVRTYGLHVLSYDDRTTFLIALCNAALLGLKEAEPVQWQEAACQQCGKITMLMAQRPAAPHRAGQEPDVWLLEQSASSAAFTTFDRREAEKWAAEGNTATPLSKGDLSLGPTDNWNAGYRAGLEAAAKVCEEMAWTRKGSQHMGAELNLTEASKRIRALTQEEGKP